MDTSRPDLNARHKPAARPSHRDDEALESDPNAFERGSILMGSDSGLKERAGCTIVYPRSCEKVDGSSCDRFEIHAPAGTTESTRSRHPIMGTIGTPGSSFLTKNFE